MSPDTAAGAVPAAPKYVLVPVEPTPEMCKAAVIFANGNAVYKNVAAEALKIEEAIYAETYSAMLAAAPKAAPAVPAGDAPAAEPVATVTECEACFTPDVCQLRGTCDHYSAERLRVAKQDAAVLAKFSDWTMLPLIATEPMQKAMQEAMQKTVLLRKSMNDVWRAAISEAPESPVSAPVGEPDWAEVLEQAEAATGLKVERHTFSIVVREIRKWLAAAAPTVAPAEPVAPQLGMTNNELMAAWRQKLTTAEPKGNDLSAFAVGIEWGWERARDTERSDWARVHHVLAKHQVHPGRTDDHLADVIDRALSATSPTVAQPLTDAHIASAMSIAFGGESVRIPPGWRAFARVIQREAAAAWGVKLGGGAV